MSLNYYNSVFSCGKGVNSFLGSRVMKLCGVSPCDAGGIVPGVRTNYGISILIKGS